jgi:hypothetical protein
VGAILFIALPIGGPKGGPWYCWTGKIVMGLKKGYRFMELGGGIDCLGKNKYGNKRKRLL